MPHVFKSINFHAHLLITEKEQKKRCANQRHVNFYYRNWKEMAAANVLACKANRRTMLSIFIIALNCMTRKVYFLPFHKSFLRFTGICLPKQLQFNVAELQPILLQVNNSTFSIPTCKCKCGTRILKFVTREYDLAFESFISVDDVWLLMDELICFQSSYHFHEI